MQRRFERSRLIPAFETLFGITVLLGLSLVLRGSGWGLLDLQPHPLWIVVLAIAVRYGGGSGYLAGGLSGLVYALLLLTRPEVRLQPLEPHMLIQPFLMFAAGAVLGEIVRAREGRVVDLETRLQTNQTTLAALWNRYEMLDKAKAELEKQITFQSDSIVTLSNLGKRLQSLNVDDLHKALVEILSSLLKVEACSLYLYQREHLSLVVGLPEGREARPMEINVYNPLIVRVAHERRVVSVRDLVRERAESVKDARGLMAGPLIFSDGQIYGVAVIESAPIGSITPSSILQFEMLLGWASQAIENAIRFEQSYAGVRLSEQLTQEAEISWMLTPGVRQR